MKPFGEGAAGLWVLTGPRHESHGEDVPASLIAVDSMVLCRARLPISKFKVCSATRTVGTLLLWRP